MRRYYGAELNALKRSQVSYVQHVSSTSQTLTSGSTITYAHGLGATPDRYWMILKNLTSDASYVPGDLLDASAYDSNPGGVGWGLVADATNVTVIITTVPVAPDKSTGVQASLTIGKWAGIVHAVKYSSV